MSRALVSHRLRAALGALLAALALLSAGCSAPSGSGGTVNLTFWSWVPGVDKAVELWNSQHPDVHVALEKIPTGSAGGYAKMHAALKAGNAPDLAQVEYQEIPAFLLEDGLVNLTQYTGQIKDKFVEWQWQQGVFGNGVYAVPQASGPMGLFYRKDVFDKLGLQPPKTWAEFEAAAQAIHQADPQTYISTVPPGNSAWLAALAWQAGAKWFSTDGDTWVVNIDNPETRRVADYWDRLRKQGVVKTEPDFADGWYKDLQSGHIVGWVSAQWGDAILQGNAPGTAGKWAVAAMPQWQAGQNVSANWGGSSTAVLHGSKHEKQAADFAVWLNSDQKSIDLLIKGGYGWPAAKDAFHGSALDEANPFFGGQKANDVFADSDKHIDNSWKWIPTIDATYQHLNDGLQKAVSGNGTFVDAVSSAQQLTVADMQAKGLKVRAGK